MSELQKQTEHPSVTATVTVLSRLFEAASGPEQVVGLAHLLNTALDMDLLRISPKAAAALSKLASAHGNSLLRAKREAEQALVTPESALVGPDGQPLA